MKTPRDILLRRHQDATPKLNAIRGGVVAAIDCPPAPQTMTWRDVGRSLRWHLAGWSAAWMVVVILNVDHSRSKTAPRPIGKAASAQQIWASLRERRQLLLDASDGSIMESSSQPGDRSEIKSARAAI